MTSVLLFRLFLLLRTTSCLAQFGPNIDVPTDVVAGTPATATILPLNLYNYDPEFVSSYTVYLTAAATSSRLNFGWDFLQEQCTSLFYYPYWTNYPLYAQSSRQYQLTLQRLSCQKPLNLRPHYHDSIRSRVIREHDLSLLNSLLRRPRRSKLRHLSQTFPNRRLHIQRFLQQRHLQPVLRNRQLVAHSTCRLRFGGAGHHSVWKFRLCQKLCGFVF